MMVEHVDLDFVAEFEEFFLRRAEFDLFHQTFFHDASVFGFKIQGLTHVYVKVQGFEIFLEYFYRFLITMLTYTTPRSFIYDTVKFDKFFLS